MREKLTCARQGAMLRSALLLMLAMTPPQLLAAATTTSSPAVRAARHRSIPVDPDTAEERTHPRDPSRRCGEPTVTAAPPRAQQEAPRPQPLGPLPQSLGGAACGSATDITAGLVCDGNFAFEDPLGIPAAGPSGHVAGSCYLDGASADNDIWYQWTNATGGPAYFQVSTDDPVNAGGDSQISIWGDCTGLDQLACDEDGAVTEPLMSLTRELLVAAGATIQIQFDGSFGNALFDRGLFRCYPPAPPSCPVAPVADGGFEAGTPNPSWTEASTNFGTPICDPVSCTGFDFARTGSWYAWFGGIAAPETGSVEQTVTIPATADRLSFWLWIETASGNATDFLRVFVDGVQVFEVIENNPRYAAYTLVSVDVRAYADGGAHAIRFEGTLSGSPDLSNFIVDDVSVECATPACTPIDPAPVADGGFEAGTPNPSWTEASTNFGTPICDLVTCGLDCTLTGAWCAWFGGIAMPETASVEQMVTIPATAARLSFGLRIEAASGNGTDFLRILVDGTQVFEVLEADPGYSSYTLASIDIRAYADDGVHAVRFEGTISGAPSQSNFFVDDVAIESCGACIAGNFPPVNRLRGVKNGSGATFTWDAPVPAPTQYNLNSVTSKDRVHVDTAHRVGWPGGNATPQCQGFGVSTCTDPDALAVAQPDLLYDQVLAACGATGDLDGPVF